MDGVRRTNKPRAEANEQASEPRLSEDETKTTTTTRTSAMTKCAVDGRLSTARKASLDLSESS